jgi:hypothetical protein
VNVCDKVLCVYELISLDFENDAINRRVSL